MQGLREHRNIIPIETSQCSGPAITQAETYIISKGVMIFKPIPPEPSKHAPREVQQSDNQRL